MCGNNLGPEGVLELWNALEHNSTVEELYVDITGITERGTENIVNCLSKNTSLKTLTYDSNSPTSVCAWQCFNMWKHCYLA